MSARDLTRIKAPARAACQDRFERTGSEDIMSHTPHDLAEEFPDSHDALRELRRTNVHAARLMDEYAEINATLHRVDSNLEPMSDIEALRLHKQRMTLKDEIARILREHMSV